jgi:hypothetical protein
VRFQDWKGVNRRFPAGTDLRGARSKKKLLLGENERRVDFDKGKARAITLSRWGEIYLTTTPERKSLSPMMPDIFNISAVSWGAICSSLRSRGHMWSNSSRSARLRLTEGRQFLRLR